MNKQNELFAGICFALSILSVSIAFILYYSGYKDFIIQFILAIPFLLFGIAGLILIFKSNDEQKVKSVE